MLRCRMGHSPALISSLFASALLAVCVLSFGLAAQQAQAQDQNQSQNQTGEAPPFFTKSCEDLFQQEDPAFRGEVTEMPMLVTFMLGYYAAKGEENGLRLLEIANRADIIPSLIEHCRATPQDSYLTALGKTIPEPLETPLENPTPMLFEAPCAAVFGPPPKTFLRSPLEFSLIQHFTLGYYTASNEQLDPVALANNRNLMVNLYDHCMEDLETPLINAIAETVPTT